MYTPRAFAETDLAGLDWLLARDPFITLTTSTEGLPFATHLPVLYARDGEHIDIRGHWARPNPQAKHAGPALVIVHGPHAYILPGWYPDKSVRNGFGQPQAGPRGEPHGHGEHTQAAARVPTWNYAAAHLYGELTPLHEESELAAIVAGLSERHESAIGGDWRYDHDNPRERAQLRGIVGFRFVPERIELKFKLNQNHPAANVHAAAEALRGQPGADAQEIAALMLDRLARRED